MVARGQWERSADIRDRRDAKIAITEPLEKFDKWRQRVAVLQSLVDRPGISRQAVIDECVDIQTQILEVRTELILALAEQRAGVAGHDRVSDVEKAMDAIVKTLREIEHRLRS